MIQERNRILVIYAANSALSLYEKTVLNELEPFGLCPLVMSFENVTPLNVKIQVETLNPTHVLMLDIPTPTIDSEFTADQWKEVGVPIFFCDAQEWAYA